MGMVVKVMATSSGIVGGVSGGGGGRGYDL